MAESVQTNLPASSPVCRLLDDEESTRSAGLRFLLRAGGVEERGLSLLSAGCVFLLSDE